MAAPLAPSQILSPELVLIDPRLAAAARASLPDPDDSLARLEPDHVPMVDGETGAALRRLTELSEVEPPRRRRPSYRVAKLVAAVAALSIDAILIADLGLYDWSSWVP